MIDRRRYDRHKRYWLGYFSAIFLSMCTGSCMFVFWMALRKFFADKIRPKVYDLILKIILIAYYVPADICW